MTDDNEYTTTPTEWSVLARTGLAHCLAPDCLNRTIGPNAAWELIYDGDGAAIGPAHHDCANTWHDRPPSRFLHL